MRKFKIYYQNPFKNLKATNIQKLLTRLDTNVIKKAINSDHISGPFLPFVSERKPHKYDDKINPTYPIALKIPFLLGVNPKSQAATGKIRFIEVNSTKLQAIKLPARRMRIKLNFPNPHFFIVSSKSA